jgi:uncharacterized protein (DUF305 family)
MKPTIVLAIAAAVALGSSAVAQTAHDMHGAKASAKDTAATKAYRAANDKMHKDMNIRFTNDPDVDFIRGMIPHHQGAIDMAKVVMQYGKNEQTRKWATDIIREQEREIKEMQAWLKANSGQ